MKIPESPPPFKKLLEKLIKTDLGMLEDKEVKTHIQKYEREYLPWDEYKRRPTPKDIPNEKIWTLIKVFRIRGFENITIGEEDFVYSLTSDMPQILHKLDKECCGNIILENVGIPHDESKIYLINSLMEEAIASSQMEGAITTRRVAKEMLRTKRRPKDSSEQMILNNYNTIQEIISNKIYYKKITSEKILELQLMLTKDTLDNPSDEGKYRDNNEIHVGDKKDPYSSYHRPPKYQNLSKYMKDFCDFFNNDEFIHPIIKATIIHFLIGYIHPFNDGNGRTARAILYCYLLKNDYWMFQYMPVSRIIKRSGTKYGLSYLYTETDNNDMTYFIKYNLRCIQEALEETKKYLVEKQKERLQSLKIIENEKQLSYRQANTLKKLHEIEGKTIEIQEVMRTYGVTYQTARTDLLGLKDMGYLTMEKKSRKFIFKANKEKIKYLKEK